MKYFLVLFSFILLTMTVACAEPVASTNEAATDTSPTAVVESVIGDESMATEESMESTQDMTEETTTETTDHAMSEEDQTNDTGSGSMAVEGTDISSAQAAWQMLPLTNARTGESFTLGDFAGQTVFIEPMATWCSNCRQQLLSVQQARATLNDSDVIFIALSVETNISDADLANYADGQGFDWTFAVMSPEILQELADTFGRTVANPPSTPHFIIRPDGTASELFTGLQSPEEIVSLVSG